MNDERIVFVLNDIRNWIRAASYTAVKASLQEVLIDDKTRQAYQKFDGDTSVEQVRAHCKMSPNAVVALAQQCISRGLMEVTADNRKRRLFDLNDFGLLQAMVDNNNPAVRNAKQKGRSKR